MQPPSPPPQGTRSARFPQALYQSSPSIFGERVRAENASSTCSHPGVHLACKLAESNLDTENPPRNVCFCTVLAHSVVPGSFHPWLQPLQLA